MLSEWWDRLRASRRQTVATGFGEATLYALADSEGSPVRMLSVGGVLQSATYTDERWDRCPFAYLRAFDHLFEAEPALSVERVLMIGGAGFAYPKQLLSDHPGVKLDVVEIDPAMVALARDHFFLDRLEQRLAAEGRGDDLRIFVEDGATFLQDGGRGFDGCEAVPFFASDAGMAAARKRLAPGGLLLANCVVEFTSDAMYRLFTQVQRLGDQFASVAVIDASDEQFGGADNYLVIASDGAYPFTGVIPYGEA